MPTQSPTTAECCDLLSNFVLSNFDNNIGGHGSENVHVVICFQTLFFLILITTLFLCSGLSALL